MSTDYAEKERAFIADLGPDTGRDLDGWMQAISASGLIERNDIIDWLRQQGFQFSKASWLERIHHNGGRLIYGEALPAEADTAGAAKPSADPETIAPQPRGAARARRAASANPFAPPAPAPEVVPEPAAIEAMAPAPILAPPPEPATATADVNAALSAAKGLRPLAELMLREIETAVPAVCLTVVDGLIVIATDKPFASLQPAARKLKLYANFGATGDGVEKATVLAPKVPPPYPFMLALDDARRIDETFRALIRRAAGL